MKNKFLFILVLILVICTERLEKIFYIGFFDLYPSRVLYVILLFYFSYKSFIEKASKEVKEIFYAALMFLTVVFFSIFKSDDLFYSFKKFLDTFTITTFIFLVYGFLQKSASRTLSIKLYRLFINYFVLVLLLIIFFGFIFYRTIDGGQLEERAFLGISFYRRISLFTDPNFYSVFLVLSFFIVYYSKIKARKVILLLTLLAILLTGSKGGFFALLGALIFYYRKRIPLLNNKTAASILVVIAISVVGLVISFPYVFIEILTSSDFFKSEYGSETALPRLLVWHAGMKSLLSNPILGIGPGNIVNVSKGQQVEGIIQHLESIGVFGLGADRIDSLATHSTYLEILFETGILGLIFYGIFTYKILKLFIESSTKFHQHFLGISLGLLSVYISLFFISYTSYYISFIIGLFLFIYDKNNKERKIILQVFLESHS